jgi:hypothetical protein
MPSTEISGICMQSLDEAGLLTCVAHQGEETSTSTEIFSQYGCDFTAPGSDCFVPLSGEPGVCTPGNDDSGFLICVATPVFNECAGKPIAANCTISLSGESGVCISEDSGPVICMPLPQLNMDSTSSSPINIIPSRSSYNPTLVTTSSNLDIFESTPSFISEKKTSSAHFTSLVFDATPTQTNIDVNFCDCVDTSSEEFCLGKLLEGTCSSYLNECSFSCKACPFQTYETCPPQFDQIVEEEKSYTCVDVFDDYTFSNCDALMFLNPTEFSCPMLEEVFGLDCSGCNCLAADACADISEECETIEPTTCSDIFCPTCSNAGLCDYSCGFCDDATTWPSSTTHVLSTTQSEFIIKTTQTTTTSTTIMHTTNHQNTPVNHQNTPVNPSHNILSSINLPSSTLRTTAWKKSTTRSSMITTTMATSSIIAEQNKNIDSPDPDHLDSEDNTVEIVGISVAGMSIHKLLLSLVVSFIFPLF